LFNAENLKVKFAIDNVKQKLKKIKNSPADLLIKKMKKSEVYTKKIKK